MRTFFAKALNASEVQVAKRLIRHVRDRFEGALKGESKREHLLAIIREPKGQDQKRTKGE